MYKLICPNCNTEIEVEFLDDIIECPNCEREVSRENAGEIKIEEEQNN